MTSRRAATVILASVVVLAAGPFRPVAAQSPVDDLRRDLAALRAEVEALRAEVARLKAPPAAEEPPAAPGADRVQATVGVLQAQMAELAQTRVESTSRMPVRLFGVIHSHLFANSANANWLESPNVVAPPFAEGPNGSFGGSLRQTRLGFTVDGPSIGSVRTSGVVAMDFFGGVPGFQTGQVMGLPRLLVGYARFSGDRTSLQVGQDHVLLAPRDPSSLAAFAFPALFRSGNLYLRAPHVRVERRLAPGVRLAGGIVAPVGGDLPGEDYRFVPPALGGERSRRPAVQVHAGFGSEDPEAAVRASAGVSGHYGWERRGSDLRASWAAALDFSARRDRVGVAGEAFVGDNLDAFGGALGQDRRAAGGWLEVQFFATPRATLNAGGGIDDVRNAGATLLARRRSRSGYGTFQFSFTPEITASLEYRWLSTTPGAADARSNHHVDWVLLYRF